MTDDIQTIRAALLGTPNERGNYLQPPTNALAALDRIEAELSRERTRREELEATLSTVRTHVCGEDPDHDNWEDYQAAIDAALLSTTDAVSEE